MNAVFARKQQIALPGDGDGVAENAEVHGAVAAAGDDPGLELPDEAVERLGPDRVAHHDVAGAGRKTACFERFRERLPELGKIAFGHRRGEQQAVILIGSHGLLGAPLRAHHEQAAILLDRRRRGKLEDLGNEIAVQVRGYLRDDLDLDALLVQALHLRLNIGSRREQAPRRFSRGRCGLG